MKRYHLIIHGDLRDQLDELSRAYKRDPGSDSGKEYVAAIKALKALSEGREAEYEGKQLGYGPSSHDLRDCAELKVPVVERTRNGRPMGPSHRMTYREFSPLPTVEDGRVVVDPDALPYRQVVAFEFRGATPDPAAVTGQRLGRNRGMPERDLHGVTGGGRPSVGPQQQGVQTTPHRIPVPPDLIKQAAILRDSPPAGTTGAPKNPPDAAAKRPDGPGKAQSQER